MSSHRDLSQQIRARRLELGLTQAELARRADTSVPTVSRYEGGWSRFEVSTLRRIATALRCELVVELVPKPARSAAPNPTEVVERLGRLFWDVRLTEAHLAENTVWVVERVLELGALDDVRMLIAHLGRPAFLRCAAEARLASPRARAFWDRVLEGEGVTCTRRFSREEAARFWRGSSP
ncbi:MAG: helix-turn-helix transcriptional regulator [Thermoanaerobaculales bacterium]|jgi:transcriptional regulator with XRE-family HTH domain|nr:helix-turn-helix transcriptional regulator [Thermoanaerobaculales bacterium]